MYVPNRFVCATLSSSEKVGLNGEFELLDCQCSALEVEQSGSMISPQMNI